MATLIPGLLLAYYTDGFFGSRTVAANTLIDGLVSPGDQSVMKMDVSEALVAQIRISLASILLLLVLQAVVAVLVMVLLAVLRVMTAVRQFALVAGGQRGGGEWGSSCTTRCCSAVFVAAEAAPVMSARWQRLKHRSMAFRDQKGVPGKGCPAGGGALVKR
ncbi:hypothetical protein [Kineosporia babensis]|uniref:Uncharacterized protein n=1 Tax=Kineosporia babensis TaxID=499548 RepID=A0A9X1SYR7_9ACTN|nr:hypothetical protein [Kineosporia babensis]MCD5316630.1 hypothetical protein [Kineosporia babensis]